jgi:predicted house-cleaning noncanonical NTP pyrophosphatase (MazG superfamily)
MKVNLKASEKWKEVNEIRKDEMIEALSKMTNQQINNWVDENVNNLADVRRVLKRIIKFMKFFVKNYKV